MLTTVLPLALVVGFSPVPVLPAVMLLMTPQARRNALAYLAAWLVVLTLLVVVILTLTGSADPEPVDEQGIGWMQVVTGAAFLIMAVVKWVKRPRSDAPAKSPKWVAALDGYTGAQSARLGALLAGANPKNLAMAVAAGAEIGLLAEDAAHAALGVAGFVLVGSIGVATPILSYLILGARIGPALERGRAWLVRNETTLSVGVLLLLGVLMVLGGLSASA